MTTIIVDSRIKCLYADKKESYGKSIHTLCNKIIPLNIKSKKNPIGFIALAGNSDEGETYLRYICELSNILDINILDEKRPKWKHLGGVIVLTTGKIYIICADGVIYPMTDQYFVDGAGQEAGFVLMDAGLAPPEIFKLIANRTSHTSPSFDYVDYTVPNAKIQYNNLFTKTN